MPRCELKLGFMASSKNIAALLVGLLAACLICNAEAEFKSDLVSVVDGAISEAGWDYSNGAQGPANWGGQCNTGTKQSPINVNLDWIHFDNWVDVPAHIYYQPAPAFVYGDGRILEVQWAGGIYNVHNLNFVLEKLVFHSPSEHTYSNKSFPLEIQFYHTCPAGLPWEEVAINTLVFEEGEQNEWLEQIIPALPTEETLGKRLFAGIVDSAGVGGSDLDWTRYYRYLGSETTPPCNESPTVVWSLLKSPLSASKEQIEKIQAALLNKPNARPIPDMPDRIIYYPASVVDLAN